MKAGTGKSKIVFPSLKLPLFGYGKMTHRSDGAETDLFARALVFETEQHTLAILSLECYYISHHLKLEILKRFNQRNKVRPLDALNLMLAAQGTHSAPGGHSHYAFHNISTHGFRPSVFSAYAEAGADALMKAFRDLGEARLFLNAGMMNSDADVAFNRSLDAYNSNPDVTERDVTATHLAVDRMMRQLRIQSSDGHEKGLLNWFGVQGTSIGSENNRIHSDNKGYAASLLENDQSEARSYVAAFLNEACADVSPNYHGRGKWWPRGKYEDPIKSAYFNGFLQYEQAKALLENEHDQIPIRPELDFVTQFINVSEIKCAPEFTPDKRHHHTGMAAAGLALLDGSPVDNPGVDSITSSLVASWVKYRNVLRRIPIIRSRQARMEFKKLQEAHGNKKILAELQEKKVLGFSNLNKLQLPPALSDLLDELKRQYQAGALREHTWVPVIVPIQIFIIGEVAIIGYPGEITTTAAKRLKECVLDVLHKRGVLDVIVTSNANEYMGYTTTYEEYQEPTYERGMTFFGHYTLAAMQTSFKKLAEQLLREPGRRAVQSEVQPPEFSTEELAKRSQPI
jgi:neutral ceramidase